MKKGQQQGENVVDLNKFTLSASVDGDSRLIDDVDIYQSVSGTGHAGYGTAVQSVSHSVNTTQFLSCGDLNAHAAISFKDVVDQVQVDNVSSSASEAAAVAPVPVPVDEAPAVEKQFVKTRKDGLPIYSSKDSTRTGGSSGNVGPICGALQPAFSSKASSKTSEPFHSANGSACTGNVTTAQDDRLSRVDSTRSLRSGNNSNYNSLPSTKEKLAAAAKLADSLAST